VIATALVIISMCLYYRFAGVVASVAVLFLLLIMWGVLQNIGAALTLPGIAGIILTIGMAIDANVLVYERVREEFAVSKRLASAMQAGYRKAFSAIIDSNLTSMIAALILLQFDSGPIKGFALTLIIGLVASLFTSLFVTRYFFAGWVRNKEHKELKMASFIQSSSVNFLKYFKPAMLIALVMVVVGALLFVKERNTLLGMDFTGGFSLTLDLPVKPGTDYKELLSSALTSNGARAEEFHIRELNHASHLRVQLGTTMNEAGHPFYGMPVAIAVKDQTYPYETNPRLVWVVDSLKKSGLELSSAQLSFLDQNWSEMSGQFSDTMRNNAIIALLAALLAILIYITIRFEFKYGMSAVLGLLHDLLITLALIAIWHYFDPSMQIDLQVIAALMTIVGYSLNDTIIIFDRIREDLRLFRKLSFKEIVNAALNKTLSRTLMTSGTTLLVLLTLTLFGGASIFNFSLVMTIGVVVGTLSSLFVAAPLLLYFHQKEREKEKVSRERPVSSIVKASSP
jgi:SecD/SecF fusion protein